MRMPLALYAAGGGDLPAAGPVSAGSVVEGTWSAGGLYCIAVVGVVVCSGEGGLSSRYCSNWESHQYLIVSRLGRFSGRGRGEGGSSKSESFS